MHSPTGLTFFARIRRTPRPYLSRSGRRTTGLKQKKISLTKAAETKNYFDSLLIENLLYARPRNIGFEVKIIFSVVTLTQNHVSFYRFLGHGKTVFFKPQMFQQPNRVQSALFYSLVLNRPVSHGFYREVPYFICFANFSLENVT